MRRPLRRWGAILLVLAAAMAVFALVMGFGRASPQVQALRASLQWPGLAGPASAESLPSMVDYPEQVGEVAIGVESSGRVHLLWTGKLNPSFDVYLFYSWSADGVTWSPYKILYYYGAYDPVVAVDDTNHRVHLVYRSNTDGILHRLVANNIVSDPVLVDSHGLSPKLAVDESTGYAYAVWQEGYLHQDSVDSQSWRLRLWYSLWDGSGWTGRKKLTLNEDTGNGAIAAAPGGRVMAGYFQDWSASQPGPLDPGSPTIPRTAYSTDGANFSLRQAASSGYPQPEKDGAFGLAYSAYDNKFYMLTYHLVSPGYSIVNRFVWNGSWSGPVDISQNETGVASTSYISAPQNQRYTYYIYGYGGKSLARKETNGVLGPVEDLSAYLIGQGYTATGGAVFMDKNGVLHWAIAGSKGGVSGLYYHKKTS